MNEFNSQCGFFPNVRGRGSNRSLLEALEAIRSTKWRTAIQALRTMSDEAKQSAAKKKLPALMFSATTRNGGHKEADLDQHSGILQCDFDHLESLDTAITLRESLRTDPHIFAAWISPRLVCHRAASIPRTACTRA